MVGNTPYRLYKSTAFNGGHQVPFVIRWPAAITEPGALRDQYTHVTDVLPTLVELIGLEPLTERAGQPARPMTGSSFAATLADAAAPSAHTEQYIEMNGHRAFYRDGWEAVTLHHRRTPYGDAEWQLFRVAEDRTQLDDLAATHPDRLAELRDAWDEAAWTNQVFPLDDGTLATRVRPGGPDLARSVTLTPANHTLDPARSRALVRARAFAVTVRCAVAAGDEGTLVAHGDQGGGYGLYVRDSRLVYVHNAYGNLVVLDGGAAPVGECELGLDVTPSADGRTWSVVLLVGDEVRATHDELAAIGMLAPFEGIDVGIDRRSPVWWEVYERHGPFPFTGTLHSVTYAAARREAHAAATGEYQD
jgi:arylsulfatase